MRECPLFYKDELDLLVRHEVEKYYRRKFNM